MNCPITWVNMNEPSPLRINWCYHCSVDVRYATMDDFSWEVIHCCVINVTEQ